MMILDWLLDNAIALLALLVAGWSAWYTKKYSGQQTEMQKEALAIEKKRERNKLHESKKAKIEVNFLERSTSTGRRPYQIRLVNKGKGDARNVRWTINGAMPSNYPDILDSDERINQIDKIKSGTGQTTKIATSKDSDKVWNVKVSWDDDANKDNNEEFELTL